VVVLDAASLTSIDEFIPVNLLGLPSCAVPVGCDDVLPQGVQLIGARFREDLVLDAAQTIEDRAPTLTPIQPRS
jgi:amidase